MANFDNFHFSIEDSEVVCLVRSLGIIGGSAHSTVLNLFESLISAFSHQGSVFQHKTFISGS